MIADQQRKQSLIFDHPDVFPTKKEIRLASCALSRVESRWTQFFFQILGQGLTSGWLEYALPRAKLREWPSHQFQRYHYAFLPSIELKTGIFCSFFIPKFWFFLGFLVPFGATLPNLLSSDNGWMGIRSGDGVDIYKTLLYILPILF